MRLSLRARAERRSRRPRHHTSTTRHSVVAKAAAAAFPLFRGCFFCTTRLLLLKKKVLSPPKRGQLSLFPCLHFPLLLALVLGPATAAISNILLYCQLKVRPRALSPTFVMFENHQKCLIWNFAPNLAKVASADSKYASWDFQSDFQPVCFVHSRRLSKQSIKNTSPINVD